MLEITVTYKERIDKYISNNTDITRNDIQELIKQNAVLVNDKVVMKANFIVNEGQNIKILKLIEKQELKIKPENIEIKVVYEDEDLLVVDKPSDLVVHPAPGHFEHTLINGLMYKYKNLSDVNGLLRPGIVHRIDKDTSGLLVVAKNNEMHNLLSNMIKDHLIKRKYLALALCSFKDKNLKINLPIGRDLKNRQKMAVTPNNSKEAITNVEVLKEFYYEGEILSLVKCSLETGRTHQIRVHLAYIKHPVYGDPIYGKKVDDFNQRLHAYNLSFIHPKTKKLINLFSFPSKEFEISNFDFLTFIEGEKEKVD